MTFFKKCSLVALLSLALAACDNAAKNSTQPTANQAAQSEQSAAATPSTPVDSGKADFDYYKAWQKAQEQLINQAMVSALEDGQENDEKSTDAKLHQAMLSSIAQIRQNAESLTLSDPEVIALKDKSLEMMALAVDMLTADSKSKAEPNNTEAQKIVLELNAKLQKVAEEGSALEQQLNEKYGNKSSENQ